MLEALLGRLRDVRVTVTTGGAWLAVIALYVHLTEEPPSTRTPFGELYQDLSGIWHGLPLTTQISALALAAGFLGLATHGLTASLSVFREILLKVLLDWGAMRSAVFELEDAIVTARGVELTREQERCVRRWFRSSKARKGSVFALRRHIVFRARVDPDLAQLDDRLSTLDADARQAMGLALPLALVPILLSGVQGVSVERQGALISAGFLIFLGLIGHGSHRSAQREREVFRAAGLPAVAVPVWMNLVDEAVRLIEVEDGSSQQDWQ